jgi:hypothetical protein
MSSKVILLDCEAGSDSVADRIADGRVVRYPTDTFEAFEKTYWALQYGQIKGDLVVVDTVSSIVNRFVLDTTLDPKDLKPNEGKTIWSLRDKMRQNQDIWNRVNYGMTYVLTGLRNLPIPTIFLIHERERDDPTLMEEGDAGKRNMPALPPKILLNVMAGSDVVLRMYRTPKMQFIDGVTYPANMRMLQIENTADAVTGVRVTPEQDAKLPKFIALPDKACGLALLAQAMGGLPRKMTVYSFPKVGKTVFGCTLP